MITTPAAHGSDASSTARVVVDPASAQASSRVLLIEDREVRVESITGDGQGYVPQLDAASEPDAAAAAPIVARYTSYDYELSVPLPKRIELSDDAHGLHASVDVLSAEENVAIDPGLFPSAEAATR